MPRKKAPLRVRRVYISDPDPEGKQRIREDLTERLRPGLSRAEVRARGDELLRLRARRRLSKAAYEDQSEALDAEARHDPQLFWDELERAFVTYWQRARKRTFYRGVTGRLRYVEKALAAWPPRRLTSSQVNLTKTIDEFGVMPDEDEEFPPPTPRVLVARIIAERATQDPEAFREFLLRERKRLTTYRKTLEDQAGPYLAADLRRGRRTNRAMREFIESVRDILKRYVVPRMPLRGDVAWQDVADVCRYFHPARMQPPRKKSRYVPDLNGGLDTTISCFDKDPVESLDTTFWFPTKDALRRICHRA